MRSLVKQPNGQYAIFSTITDDFIISDATPEEMIEILVEEQRSKIEEEINNKVKILNGADRRDCFPAYGYHDKTTWEECEKTRNSVHGRRK